jgi:hypothetical protein
MKFTNAVKKMKALGPVQMDEIGDAILTLDRYSMGVSKHASCDMVDAIWTRSFATNHQRFHRSFTAAMEFLASRGE